MEANRGQGGIQLLLAAEQEAQHIVNGARNAKMARLKQAKDEAEKEIAEYRAHVEAEFQKKLAEVNKSQIKIHRQESSIRLKRIDPRVLQCIAHPRSTINFMFVLRFLAGPVNSKCKFMGSNMNLNVDLNWTAVDPYAPCRLSRISSCYINTQYYERLLYMLNEYFCIIKQSSGDSGANVKRLELETEAKIHHLKTEAARISHDVVHMLLKHVTTVKN
ncbi:hypothetical protein HHK36_010833 [Tetracentron sinense]|uniref:V-type proton ATPase subunit G n=1 Tax=Tetracentron sinense TaxID=13715 RepID=A0A834ZCL4_TETSI|nr:hypothetical protein HHK36_010833 [Tetracentron sinense]